MRVTVIQRNVGLQLATTINVGKRKYTANVYRRLQSGRTSNGVEDFLEVFTNGGSFDDCFAALSDPPPPVLSPDEERSQALESGKADLLEKVRRGLQRLVERGQQAQALLNDLQIEGTDLVGPPAEGMGICCVCHKTFRLHYIAGTTDLCQKHINPEYT